METDVSAWTNIKAIAAGSYHTVGLKEDGTVVAVGDNGYGQLNVSTWTNISYCSRQNFTLGQEDEHS
jgi:alpha-tubulin suppressor-like RCC1 family protein